MSSSAEVELQDLARDAAPTAGRKKAGPRLLYYEKPRFALDGTATNSASRTPVHFTSLEGDLSIGLSLRPSRNSSERDPGTRGDLVVASWDEADPDGTADWRALESKFYVLVVLQCAFIVALFSGAIRDPSRVERGLPKLKAEFPGVQAPFARESYLDEQEEFLPEFIVELSSAFLAIAATALKSSVGLTLYMLILIILFMVAAPNSPTFLHVLRFPIYLALAFFAYKLRNKLMVNWIYDAPARAPTGN